MLEVPEEAPGLGGKGNGEEGENLFSSEIPAAPGHPLNSAEGQ